MLSANISESEVTIWSVVKYMLSINLRVVGDNTMNSLIFTQIMNKLGSLTKEGFKITASNVIYFIFNAFYHEVRHRVIFDTKDWTEAIHFSQNKNNVRNSSSVS